MKAQYAIGAGMLGLLGVGAVLAGIMLAATHEADELPVWVPSGAEYMSNISKATFIQRLKPIAQELEQATGLSAVFLLSQAAVESAWGRVTPGNMLFGRKWHRSMPLERRQLLRTWEERLDERELAAIKAGAGGRQYIRSETRNGRAGHLIRDWFVRYDSWEHCIREQVDFLARKWPKAFGVSAERACEVVAGLTGGPKYATASDYASTLKRTVSMVRSLTGEGWA